MAWIHNLYSPLKVAGTDLAFSYGIVHTDRDALEESNEHFFSATQSDRIVTTAIAYAQIEGAKARQNGTQEFQPVVTLEHSDDGNRIVYTLRVILDFARRVLNIPFGDWVRSRDSDDEKAEHVMHAEGARAQIEHGCTIAAASDVPVQIKAGVQPRSTEV